MSHALAVLCRTQPFDGDSITIAMRAEKSRNRIWSNVRLTTRWPIQKVSGYLMKFSMLYRQPCRVDAAIQSIWLRLDPWEYKNYDFWLDVNRAQNRHLQPMGCPNWKGIQWLLFRVHRGTSDLWYLLDIRKLSSLRKFIARIDLPLRFKSFHSPGHQEPIDYSFQKKGTCNIPQQNRQAARRPPTKWLYGTIYALELYLCLCC
jgi:hypothetical protein